MTPRSGPREPSPVPPEPGKTDPIPPEMPAGGYRGSGYGKDFSIYSLEDYTQIKHFMAKFE